MTVKETSKWSEMAKNKTCRMPGTSYDSDSHLIFATSPGACLSMNALKSSPRMAFATNSRFVWLLVRQWAGSVVFGDLLRLAVSIYPSRVFGGCPACHIHFCFGSWNSWLSPKWVKYGAATRCWHSGGLLASASAKVVPCCCGPDFLSSVLYPVF